MAGFWEFVADLTLWGLVFEVWQEDEQSLPLFKLLVAGVC